MKVFLDTNIYISHYRSGLHQELLYQLNSEHLLYLHGFVLAELYAGALTPKFIRELKRLENIFSSRNRIIIPTLRDLKEAGHIVAQSKSHIQLSDAVLASSARHEGMILISEDGDFLEIQKIRAFTFQKVYLH